MCEADGCSFRHCEEDYGAGHVDGRMRLNILTICVWRGPMKTQEQASICVRGKRIKLDLVDAYED